MMSFDVCVCSVSECVWSCSRSVGWVTGRIPRRSRRTHVGRRCPHQVPPPGVPTRCPDQVRRKLFCTTYFFFENQSMVDFQIRNQSSGGDLDENGRFLYWKCISRWTFSIILRWGRSWGKWLFSLLKMRFALDFFNHFTMGAILMKMAVFFFENAFCVGLFQSFYNGGDLDENGCFP